jgi:hypothetical protein
MIYLSGATKLENIGKREDVGLMLGYRGAGLSHSRSILNRTVWAADNGCFSNPELDPEDFLKWLKKLSSGLTKCLFAVAPDVVADPIETWIRSKPILPKIRNLGYKAALVAQDGMEDRPVSWESFDTLFIGGSTEWKLSEGAFYLLNEARRRGKWTHMGRVNSRRRLRIAVTAGCDSVDGTLLCFAPDRRFRQLSGWMTELQRQPFLFDHQQEIDEVCWQYALV